MFTFLLGKVLAPATFNRLLLLGLTELQAAIHFNVAAQSETE